jgi:type IV pilus assembly protein PilV
MLTHTQIRYCSQAGTSLIEVLITMVILAFGLLGLAGMQSKLHLTTVESYQRAQAIVLLNDLSERINANRALADSYVTANLGTGDSEPEDCSGVAVGPSRDKCEISNALKGAAEKKGSANTGAMTNARGCVERLQPVNNVTCTPGIYKVTVEWQGLHKTKEPGDSCGGSIYGADGYRRAISVTVGVGTPTCSPS